VTPVEHWLTRRLPGIDLRVVATPDSVVVRHATPAPRGRRFPVLFALRRVEGRWIADRDYQRGLIGQTIEFLELLS
jgi:predicted thioesterase